MTCRLRVRWERNGPAERPPDGCGSPLKSLPKGPMLFLSGFGGNHRLREPSASINSFLPIAVRTTPQSLMN